MDNPPESNFSFELMLLSILAGGLFCGVHLLNGWLLRQVEFTQHISLIYLPGFLRLVNVLILGLFWGTAATAIGGIMLMAWTSESWDIALSNVAVSAGVATLAIVVLQALLQRRLSLSKLSDLLRLALLYALLNVWHSPKSVDKYDVKTEMENCKCNDRNMPPSSKTRQLNKSSIKATRLSM